MKIVASDYSWLNTQRDLLKRASNRAKREAIVRLAPVRRISESRHEKRRRDYSPFLPPLGDVDTSFVKCLDQDGIVFRAFDDLAADDFDTLAASLQDLLPTLASPPATGGTASRPTDDELVAHVGLFQWGLSAQMLDIAENYFGVPVWYYGADVRREVADGATTSVRQWHKDVEDRRVFKILVWLNDVGKDGGPFGYLSYEDSKDATAKLGYVGGYVTEARMDAVIPREKWRTATGPTWTAVCVDTAHLFHRATPPVGSDRYSVTFTWTSRRPVKFQPVPGTAAKYVGPLFSGLSRRQVDALAPQWRALPVL